MEDNAWNIVRDYLERATPAQRHIYAAKSNYDDNGPALRLLLDDAQTDRATALMIYWNLGAEWHAQYEEGDADHAERIGLLRLIEQRYPTWYADHGIWFDPAHSDGTRMGEYAHVPQRRAIPAKMRVAAPGGEYVDTDNPDGYDDGLPLELAERLYDL